MTFLAHIDTAGQAIAVIGIGLSAFASGIATGLRLAAKHRTGDAPAKRPDHVYEPPTHGW